MRRLRPARMFLVVCCLQSASCVVSALRSEEMGGKMAAQFQIVAEEIIGTCENPNNGAGPEANTIRYAQLRLKR